MLIHTDFLGSAANGNVVFVQHNADFVHETYLFFIVALELGAGCCAGGCGERGIDFGKQAENVFSRDRLGLGLGLGDGGGHRECCLGEKTKRLKQRKRKRKESTGTR